MDSWKHHAFAFVSGVLSEEHVLEVAQEALQRCPPPGSEEAEKHRDFGAGKFGRVFPSGDAAGDAFNRIAVAPRLLAAVSQLLDTPLHEIRLTQCELWPKYGYAPEGEQENRDQRIHADYPNHTLVAPPPWHRPEAVEVIIYLSDVDECGGATAAVPRDGDDDPKYAYERLQQTPGVGPLPIINDRTAAEAMILERDPELHAYRASLYAAERRVRYRPGDVLLYRHDTWHRGTPLKSKALRLVVNMTFAKKEAEWVHVLHTGWTWAMYSSEKTMERLLAECTLEQRAVLGFPAPESPYWCTQTIAAVRNRWAPLVIDLTPYEEAVRKRGE